MISKVGPEIIMRRGIRPAKSLGPIEPRTAIYLTSKEARPKERRVFAVVDDVSEDVFPVVTYVSCGFSGGKAFFAQVSADLAEFRERFDLHNPFIGLGALLPWKPNARVDQPVIYKLQGIKMTTGSPLLGTGGISLTFRNSADVVMDLDFLDFVGRRHATREAAPE